MIAETFAISLVYCKDYQHNKGRDLKENQDQNALFPLNIKRLKTRTYPVGIYLLKINIKNFKERCVNCPKLSKRKTLEQLHWHRDIKKHWRRPGVFPDYFEIKVQTSKNYETWNKLCSNMTHKKMYLQTCSNFRKTILKILLRRFITLLLAFSFEDWISKYQTWK